MNINEMWERLAQHQPYADQRGYGPEWAAMCAERTADAALAAWAAMCAERTADAALAAWAAAAAALAAKAAEEQE